MLEYLFSNIPLVQTLFLEHLLIITIGIGLAILLASFLSFFALQSLYLKKQILAISSIAITIPSIALFALMIPLLSYFDAGIGKTQAIIALVLYSQLPIISNILTAIEDIDPSIKDASYAMGYSYTKSLVLIQLPLALPVCIAGIRNATVMGVGITAIAAYVGAGGLGVLIQQGISRSNMDMVLSGAVLTALLAILLDTFLALIQKILHPKGV